MSITVGWNTAVKAGLTREDMDSWALRSHQRAVAGIDNGSFVDEIFPFEVSRRDGSTFTFAVDEHPRRDTSMEKLASLKPLHPEIEGFNITAGNVCGGNDGAAAMVIAERGLAEALGVEPLAIVRAWASVGVPPAETGLAPTVAIPKLLERAGLAIDDVDLWEINEAFASVPDAACRILGIDDAKVNVLGSGCSLGHPVAATGARHDRHPRSRAASPGRRYGGGRNVRRWRDGERSRPRRARAVDHSAPNVSSNSAFHPDLRRVALLLPRRVVGPRLLRCIRVLEAAQRRRRPKPGVEVHPVGAVSVRLHHPPRQMPGPRPAVLWIHGGGYVMGTAAQEDALCRHYAEQLGAVVAAVEYRVAPEHPFPAALHDCHDALVWLANRDDVDAEHVAIGGASAGGGLAAALALLARERGEVQPAFQLLAYPMLDDRTALRTDIDERHFRLWNNTANRFGWRCYTGEAPGGPGISGLAAPSRSEDLSGLPPAWIGVGTLDLFHDEDLAYAERLRAAGVSCEVFVVDGAFHGFDIVRPSAPVSQRFRAEQVAALASALRCW